MASKLVKGNTAVVIGALYAGADCYFGYPITPASEVLQEASKYFPMVGRKFLQAESEEASINMCYGAASAGHRVFTASSGPGISLMSEGISYCAGAQLPVVIVDVMRAGPGLGNIGPEQGDYNQVVKGGGHGAYRCLVFTPDSVQEMCDCGYNAFAMCEKYRTPAYILADGVIGQMMESVTLPEPTDYVFDPEWAVNKYNDKGEANYLTTIYLENDELERRNNFLQEKFRRIQENEQSAEEYMTDDAELVFVAYGISARIARTAVRELRNEGYKVGLLRPKMVFPFPERALNKLVNAGTVKNFLCVELSPGQMIEDVKLSIECRRPVHLAYRMGGNIPSVREICEKAVAILKGAC